MIDILDKKTLENRFAEDFSSPLFPILADIYLSEGDLRRARMVCEVGLDHDSNNTDGKFVFARVAMKEENFTLAEKWLKQVVDENPAHFNGLRMLIRLEIKMSRSPKTIQKYINRLLHFLPNDSECREWMDQLQVSINESADKKQKKSGPVKKDKKTETIKNQIYNVDKSMATFTMVQVLKTQKHFNQALALLDVLESIGQDKNKIQQEKEDVLRRISEFQQ